MAFNLTDGTVLKLTPKLATATYDVLSGADLLGQFAALHGAQVQVLVKELPVQNVAHGVLQRPPVAVEHPAGQDRFFLFVI